ncbi:MAG: STAS domain-containing protein [Undibacterium sp.]|jgi:phospholipid transport system transporter-binding protein|uniref:STAS domain-containing protein n=1 Tax=Undibacterium sp. TaxID=1914977 RepID=UPI0027234DE1|nr:STAS domain-containing protein [Undibacterium sp.]MDO8654632.1 STAS domain-containing protein [Undibacterium sp.]
MYQPDQELSLRNAVSSMQAGLTAIAQGQMDFDLSALSVVDSAAVAVMLEWQRAASAQGKSLLFHGVPPSVGSLIALYGVAEFLPATVSERH